MRQKVERHCQWRSKSVRSTMHQLLGRARLCSRTLAYRGALPQAQALAYRRLWSMQVYGQAPPHLHELLPPVVLVVVVRHKVCFVRVQVLAHTPVASS
jgi:hypothetical protein